MLKITPRHGLMEQMPACDIKGFGVTSHQPVRKNDYESEQWEQEKHQEREGIKNPIHAVPYHGNGTSAMPEESAKKTGQNKEGRHSEEMDKPDAKRQDACINGAFDLCEKRGGRVDDNAEHHQYASI
tara:strand:+ start:315 stop:695 length:381 start_codon:yes stop_codon:yes gene_type:complete